MQESIQIGMNENIKPIYPSHMFEFIHHLGYGCHVFHGLNIWSKWANFTIINMAENTFTLPSDQILDMWNINREVGKDCFFFFF